MEIGTLFLKSNSRVLSLFLN